jgi:hypothetical protein
MLCDSRWETNFFVSNAADTLKQLLRSIQQKQNLETVPNHQPKLGRNIVQRQLQVF